MREGNCSNSIARQGDLRAPIAEDFAVPRTPSRPGGRMRRSAGRFLTGPDFLPAPGALAGLQHLLAQADGLGRNLDEFVVGNKLNGLLQAQLAVRDQAYGFVGGRRAHIGELLLFCDVDFHVLLARILADNHALIDFDGRSDEELTAFLEAPKGVGRGYTGAISDEGAGRPKRHIAPVFGPTIENRMNEGGTAG